VRRGEHALIREARASLTRWAHLPDMTRAELRRRVTEQYQELPLILGTARLDQWIWEYLRERRDGQQLPLFGAFPGGAVRERESWSVADYLTQDGKYLQAVDKNAALRSRLAADFEAKFGTTMAEAAERLARRKASEYQDELFPAPAVSELAS